MSKELVVIESVKATQYLGCPERTLSVTDSVGGRRKPGSCIKTVTVDMNLPYEIGSVIACPARAPGSLWRAYNGAEELPH